MIKTFYKLDMAKKETYTSIYITVHTSYGDLGLNCLNKFAELWKVKEDLLMIAIFSSPVWKYR